MYVVLNTTLFLDILFCLVITGSALGGKYVSMSNYRVGIRG